jgi:type III secretion protein S
MTTADVSQLTSEALLLTLILSMPPIVVATLVGLIVSLLQAITQIQEQTLSTAVKLIAVTLVLLGLSGWLGGELYRYTLRIFALLGSP